MVKNIYPIGLHVKYTLFLSHLNANLIFSTDSRKILETKFHKNPSSVSRVPRVQTDTHDEANIRFSQFSEGAKKVTCKFLIFKIIIDL
jgi:hypothetical protein